KTVHVGETATLTCVLPNEELGSRKVQWYKQRVGDTLKLLVSLSGKPSSEFFQSRFSAHNSKDFSNLTIWNVAQEDEGMYHCGIDTWIKLEWSGTYLLDGCVYRFSKNVGSSDAGTYYCAIKDTQMFSAVVFAVMEIYLLLLGMKQSTVEDFFHLIDNALLCVEIML
uniref:Ig-like domain-containing protein n=1 Tax=Astatotilapia calliptera TaxID=8154 RepID=A0AAX7T3V7_ASTCA